MTTMTAEYFLSLNDRRREAVLTTKGVFLTQREIGGFVYDLYRVDSFYVEFRYSISGNSTVITNVFTALENSAHYHQGTLT